MAKTSHTFPALDIQSLPGPETIKRRELQNGVVVLARENFASPSVVISGYLLGGSLSDTWEQPGLADLTISSLMRGTPKRDFQEIYESIESIGASFHVGTGKHTLSFFSKGLAEDLQSLLELLSDILRNPAFPETQIKRLVAEKLTALGLRDQNTSAKAQLAFNEIVYPNHPYQLPTDGFSETISQLTIKDMRDYHRKHVGPQGMVIAIVGSIGTQEAIEAVEKQFSNWQNPHQESIPEIPPANRPEGLLRKEVFLDGKVQSDLVIGTPGPSRFDPHYLAAALGNSILGRFGLFGRIGDRVRESAGLAYYAYSSVSGGPGPGAWQVIAGVNPKNIESAIELILDEIRKFVVKPVTSGELTDNQTNFIGRLPLQLETNEGVSGALVHMERYGLGIDYYQRYPGLIAAITRDEVLHVAGRFLDADNIAVVIAGPDFHGG
jgi:zinc protease